jgi:hypothetical protein
MLNQTMQNQTIFAKIKLCKICLQKIKQGKLYLPKSNYANYKIKRQNMFAKIEFENLYQEIIFQLL